LLSLRPPRRIAEEEERTMQNQTAADLTVPEREQIDWIPMAPFWGVQIAAVVCVAIYGWSWSGLLLALAIYAVRMFGLTAGYHRYFAHRSYKTSRVFQFLLALLATTATQKGPLWWAGHHRRHHKYSDQPQDPHSVTQRGFFWAHLGWILVKRFVDTDYERIKDFAKYPELRWLNKWHLLPPIALAVTLYLVAGHWGVTWGFLVSNTLLWHGTFCVNSLAHVFGRRAYDTDDTSRNSLLIALFTLGEGWHNNHHYYQASERQGFYWYQLDITHCVLKVFSWVGLVWDLNEPPRHVRDRRIGAVVPEIEPTAPPPAAETAPTLPA
jgi:stearoyl-CoA desaturase (delta-9 desaturase)